MKKIFLFLTALFTGFIAAQQTVETTPRLTRAEVYLNDARLFYNTQVKVTAGKQKIILHGLSPHMVQESFSLKGLGKADIIDIKFRPNFLHGKRESAEIKKLKQQLSALRQKINTIQADIKALEEEKKILEANRSNKQNTSLALLQQKIRYFKERIKSIHQQLFKLRQQLQPLQEKEKALQNQINQWQKRLKKNSTDAVITLQSGKPQTLSLSIDYITRQAYWRPVYIIRSAGDKQPLQWTYKGQITQNTGIDWDNIQVSLSTYRPQYHIHVPGVEPWYLYPVQYRTYQARKKSENMAAPQVITMEAEADQISAAPVQETESTLDVQYTLNQKYDVLSGNEPTLVQLKEFTTPGEYTYFAVPYKTNRAFLTVEVTDLSNHRLIPGNARLYFQDRFTGQAYIDPLNRLEKLRLSFGHDPEIHIVRKRTDNFKDYQLIGSKVTVKRQYQITVTNRKKIPVDIIIKDRVPVSQDEKIEVKNVRIQNGGKVDGNGIITWKKTIQPGQKITLNFGFEVKYPKDYNLRL